MFARVSLITRSEKNALVIPEQAIVPQGEDQFVFKVVDGRAVRVKIEVGQRRDSKVEVLKGLAANDTVVIAGQLKLRDGMSVVMAPGVADAAAAASAPQPAPEMVGRASSMTDVISPARAAPAPAARRKADSAPAAIPRS
jgi:hypothetical protein